MIVPTENGSTEEVVATAIVWDYADDHVYILTNYHTWETEDYFYCFPPPGNSKKRKAPDIKKKKGGKNKSDDEDSDCNEEMGPVTMKLYNENGFSYEFELSSDTFLCCEKDEDFAVLKLPRSEFTLPRIPISLNLLVTMKIHAFGYIGHTKTFNITRGEVINLIPEGFTMNLLSAEGFSGAAILADVFGRAVGYMAGNLDASKNKNSQHQSYAFTFNRVAVVTKRKVTPSNFPAGVAINTPSSRKK
jgi:hypothetical protein